MADPTNIGPWIVSGAALLQVWAIAALNRLRHGVAEIYEAENVQVSYGMQGPALGLFGTLRARRKDVFVRRIDAVVIRKRDSATHRLTWNSFLSGTRWLGSLGTPRNDQLEPVWSFLLKTNDSLRYRLFFIDSAFIAEKRSKIERVREMWFDFVRERNTHLPALPGGALVPAGQTVPNDDLFREFAGATAEVIDLYSELERGMYWTAGEYAVEMRVECADPVVHTARSGTSC